MAKENSGELLKTLDECLDKIDRLESQFKLQGEKLSQAEQDWKSIFDTITDMITIHDADFNIIRANRSAEKILDLPILNVAKVKCFKYYHGTDCPPQGCPSCLTMKTGQPSSFELYEPHLKRHIEVRAIPRFDTNRKQIGLIHIVRDITERKLADEELDKHRHRLEDIVEERTSELRSANEKLTEALARVKSLSGLLPICAWCKKKMRNEKDEWEPLENYIEKRSEAKFTHGICPECRRKFEADTAREEEKQG